MTQVSHTPGPWRVRRNQTPGQFVTSEKVCDAHNSVICNLHVNAEANGLLIAAAPKLLSLARKLLTVAEDGFVTKAYRSQLIEETKAVIAEATGEEKTDA